ncbi:flp-19 [Pristionchus pacificus]|uniref:Uncharacterized protein n=1 Tax=Pristionchus pacificus TaxID=54126 RepID=A0A2A6C5P5_PRIPA|nr:flp-19 [Pristionchus pacificus]|eukprot:PDM73460.1 hypothetical protein PRIPAC_40816 [Pristionchus pacificus]
MLTARLLVCVFLAVLCAVVLSAEYDDYEQQRGAPAQFDAFPRALRSELPSYSKKWANQVRFGKRSSGAGGQRSWASQVRFG